MVSIIIVCVQNFWENYEHWQLKQALADFKLYKEQKQQEAFVML